MQYIHFSVDDTILLFADLEQNKDVYTSIFENATLKYFQRLHKQYGLKVTFYCFYEFSNVSLENITSQYRKEFEENSHWLQFGFHAYDAGREYDKDSFHYSITNDYLTVIQALENIVGEKAISKHLRLEKFSLNEGNANCLKDVGIQILFGSDTLEKNSYYLNSEQSYQLFTKGYYYDWKKQLQFYKTDIRIEQSKGVEDMIQDIKGDSYLVIFTHEWLLSDLLKEKMELLLKQLQKYKYQFSI